MYLPNSFNKFAKVIRPKRLIRRFWVSPQDDHAVKTTAADCWRLLTEGAITSFPRLLCRAQYTVRQMNADSKKLATTAIQMLCFEITKDISRLLVWWVFFWAFFVYGPLLLSSTESVDVFLLEGKFEACVFSRMRNSAIIPWKTSPVGLLTLLWARSRGRRVPRGLLGMNGNPRWSSGTALLLPIDIFSFWASVVGTPVVVTFCTLVTLGEVLLWDTSRLIRCTWLTLLESRSICCKLAAATGVDINRKYEQIISTVTTRTIGQNDFIFTTGQASIEWHKAIIPPSSCMKIFAVLSFEGFRKSDSLAVF